MRNPELWKKFETTAIVFSDGTDLISALQRQFGLSLSAASEHLHNYACFLYLSAISGEALHPGTEVDRIWQLHYRDRAAWSDFQIHIFGQGSDRQLPAWSSAKNLSYMRYLELKQREFPSQTTRERLDKARVGRCIRLGLPVAAILGVMVSPALAIATVSVSLLYPFIYAMRAMVQRLGSRAFYDPCNHDSYTNPFL